MEESLVFSTSPLCPLAAEAVESEDCIYFYLYDMNFEEEKLMTRSACWVKNRKKAPEQFDIVQMEDGKAPALPAQYCKDPEDIAPLNKEQLSIIWSKEGHICALYDQDEILAIIPSWAVPGQMSGYSRNSKANHMSGWVLESDNALIARIEEGRQFWEQNFEDTWMAYSTRWLTQLQQRYGEPVSCLRLSREEELLTIFLMIYEKAGIRYAFSVGAALFSMPNTDQYFEDYEAKAKGEFAFAWKQGALSEAEEQELYRQFSAIVHLPWQAVDYIGHGHTLDFYLPISPYVLCVRDDSELENLVVDDINVNWLIPITEQEFHQMQEVQSNQELIKKLKRDHRHIYMEEIIDGAA